MNKLTKIALTVTVLDSLFSEQQLLNGDHASAT